MSKLKFYADVPDDPNAWISDFAHPFEMTKHKGGSATFASETDSEFKIEVSGKNLQFKAGELVGGKVTSIEFSHDGETYLTIDDTSFKAAVVQEHMDFVGAGLFLDAVQGRDTIKGSNDHDALFGVTGNDRITGRDGDDIINGGMGDDRLTGGGGADEFWFYEEEVGRDVITDFDASGGVGDQDLINLQGMAYTVEKFGKGNTLISFDDDQEIVLLGVKPKEIDDSDFVM